MGQKELAVKAVNQSVNLADYTGPGKWYEIDGTLHIRDVARSGAWAADASGSGPTTFQLNENAALTDWMVGWYIQPDINFQVYLPITSVDPNNQTLTVAGDYSSLGDEGTSFRIYAPPGVERRG